MDLDAINVVSLFSGCGGLDLGFKNAGFQTVYATDNWDIACKTLQFNNISKEIEQIDVREKDFSEILKKHQRIDCLIGGPPCPPYSQTRHYLVGKKSGFEDEKAGFAVPEYFRAVKELKPKVFVFENVDGFIHKTHIEAFNYLKEESLKLGYTISYKVVNMADYGVPQTRKRFICVGVLNHEPFVFPEATNEESGKKKPIWVSCKETIGEFDTITSDEKKQRPGGKDYSLLVDIPAGDNYLYYTEKRGYPEPKFKWKGRYWTFLLKLSPDRPSWTIQASFSQNQGPFHWRNRFLRIEELKRLQTFPDDYQFCGDFKEQWRQIGNAVPPLFAKILANKIKEDLFK